MCLHIHFLLVISTVLLFLAGCREAFTPPTGPGAGVWDHLESAICFFTNPTHCLACTICHSNAPPHHRQHHKPQRGPSYPCVTFALYASVLPSLMTSSPDRPMCQWSCCAMLIFIQKLCWMDDKSDKLCMCILDSVEKSRIERLGCLLHFFFFFLKRRLPLPRLHGRSTCLIASVAESEKMSTLQHRPILIYEGCIEIN